MCCLTSVAPTCNATRVQCANGACSYLRVACLLGLLLTEVSLRRLTRHLWSSCCILYSPKSCHGQLTRRATGVDQVINRDIYLQRHDSCEGVAGRSASGCCQAKTWAGEV